MEPEKKRERGRDIGKTGATVAENVKRLRGGHTSLRDLELKLDRLGVKISASGLQKIEAGTRRVDADEIMGLAVALGVNANTLLLPDDSSLNDVSSNVTAAPEVVTGEEVWGWGNGFNRLSNQGIFLRLSEGLEMRNVNDVSQRVDSMLLDTLMFMPDEGDEDALRKLIFSAYHHAKNLKDEEVLSLWHVDANGKATEVGSLPQTVGNISAWMNRIKKTVVGIATNSAESAVSRDDVLRALGDKVDGNDS